MYGVVLHRVDLTCLLYTSVREMASWLIDIHGQHDNQLLLNESHHIDILDAYAKESLAEVKAASVSYTHLPVTGCVADGQADE